MVASAPVKLFICSSGC